MKTRKQILEEYGSHLGGDILKELKGVGVKRNEFNEDMFYQDDIEKAESKVIRNWKGHKNRFFDLINSL